MTNRPNSLCNLRHAAGWLIVAVLVLAATLPAQAQSDAPALANEQALVQTPPSTPEYLPGEILVGVRDGEIQSANLLAEMQAQVIEAFDAGDPADGVTTLLLHVPIGSEEQAIAALQAAPAVVYAEPNWLVYAADEPLTTGATVEPGFAVNDPFYAARQWYLQRVGMSRAWQMSQSSSAFGGQLATVTVAVIDSGIDEGHPEFSGRLLPSVNYVSPGAAVVDDCGHGTHVAGLVAAGLNDSIGIAGPAPARIQARKVLAASIGGCTGSVANVAKAIREAADAGMDIINLSLTLSSDNSTMRSAVEYAGGKGALMIAAAGNAAASSVYYPARYPQVMAVASLDYSDDHPSYSNSGNEIEIAAPGGAGSTPIFATWSTAAIARCTSGFQSANGGSYCNSTGTSMAAGIVSGIAALVLAVAPDLSASEVRSILRDTATPLPLDAKLVGSGKINAPAALRRLLTSDMTISPMSFFRVAPFASQPYTLTVRIDNPSLDNLDWKASLPASSWLKLNGAIGSTLGGSVRFGEPDFLTLTVSPTALITGAYASTLAITGTRTDGSKLTQQVGIFHTVGNQADFTVLYLPMIQSPGGASQPAPSSTPFRWETPAQPSDRAVHGMTSDSSVPVTLPPTFTFPFNGQAFNELRLHSQGLVSFPSTAVSGTQPNTCLPTTTQPNQAIFGWWTTLDSGAVSARVSTFVVDQDRYVVEFTNTPSLSATQPYTVSFQIVLHDNGDIGLNYAHVPEFIGAPDDVTIGVSATNGLFHNLVACASGSTVFGTLPSNAQSLIIEAGEVY